jgi:hypothetical protein
MRFSKVFSRYVGTVPEGRIELGDDSVPNGADGAPGTAPSPDDDNVLVARFSNDNGEPAKRVLVAYNYVGSDSPVGLPASVYLWDTLTLRWYLAGTGTLTNGTYTAFDVVSPDDGMYGGANEFRRPTAGATSALIIVEDPGGAPDGEHQFALCSDIAASAAAVTITGGSATASNQLLQLAQETTTATATAAINTKTPSLGQAAMAASVPVAIASNQSAVPISAASLPLPSGASTAAKQPALGTAGTASADVITVQGIAGMTAMKVDGSDVTQPVSAASLPLPSGAATAANQATANTSLASIDGTATSFTRVSQTTAAGGFVVKGSAGRLKDASIQILAAVATGTYYVMFIDAATLSDGAGKTLLRSSIEVNHVSGSTDTISVNNFDGAASSAGIVIAVSSSATLTTLTQVASSMIGTARYL